MAEFNRKYGGHIGFAAHAHWKGKGTAEEGRGEERREGNGGILGCRGQCPGPLLSPARNPGAHPRWRMCFLYPTAH